LELQACPSCGGSVAIIYVSPVPDPRRPGVGLCECRECQAEWTVRFTPSELAELADKSPVPIDWSSDWPSTDPLKVNHR
jgi:hypothetical protein